MHSDANAHTPTFLAAAAAGTVGATLAASLRRKPGRDFALAWMRQDNHQLLACVKHGNNADKRCVPIASPSELRSMSMGWL